MKLEKKNVDDILPLTSTQEGILFHYLYGGSEHQYFEQTCIYLGGSLDRSAFEKAWQYVVRQHDALRTSFVWEKVKKPLQVIRKMNDPELSYADLSPLSDDERMAQIAAIKKTDKEKGFDLREVPCRVGIYKLGEKSFLLIISAHSILFDGWSFNIILKDFFDVYGKIYRNEPVSPAARHQFRDYIRLIRSMEGKDEQAYWQEYLKDYEIREIPFKETALSGPSTGMGTHTLVIPASQTAMIENLSKKSGFGIASFFYALWGVLLARICGEDDIIFGTTFSGRSARLKGIESIVGNFLNTLPVRVRLKEHDTILSLLLATTADIRDKQSYDQTSLFKIRDYARVPALGQLFDSLVIFENYPINKDSFEQNAPLRIEDYTFEHTSHYDLTLFIVRASENYEVHFAYDSNKMEKKSLIRLSTYFDSLINRALQDITAPLHAVPVITGAEQKRLINAFNDTQAPYRRDITLKQLLEEKQAQFSEHIAVECGDTRITYGELHERANRIAYSLQRELGGNKIYVAVLADRSVEMIVSVLAIIKAGYAYVPVDPRLPNGRIHKMVNNLAIECAITTPSFETKIESLVQEGSPISVMYSIGAEERMKRAGTQQGWGPLIQQERGSLVDTGSPEDIAYVIFTSGSTGIPKGVVVQHRPVINIIEWINKTYAINERDRLLCVASLGFDLSVYDIFGILCKGGTIYVATHEDLVAPDTLLGILVKEKITVWNSAPAVLQNLVQWNELQSRPLTSPDLRLVMLSGDWIGLQLPGKVARYFAGAKVISLGGATEATIWSNYYPVNGIEPSWHSIPYGKPIQNCRYYVLDRDLSPCPLGITGDLYIGGECLALGYINDIPLTAAKFVNDPFFDGGKMYATGDLAKWHEDGNMELIGRKDNQVKIRGYRIELGEIESHLAGIPGIDQALAIVNGTDKGDKYICAYYLGENEMDPVRIKKELSLTLPSYMIPSHVIRIDELPVTANGKIDRQRLPLPGEESSGPVQAPQNPMQAEIIAIWAEILHLPPHVIGIQSNFFELGGHSLNMTELTSRLSAKYNINLRLRDVFAAATVEKIFQIVAEKLFKDKRNIQHAEKKEYYPLTPAQLRMYAQQEANKSGIINNISGGAMIKGPLDLPRIQEIFGRFVQVHESFRSSFAITQGKLVQRIRDRVDFEVEYYSAGRTGLDKAIQAFIRPFDLGMAPLIRAAVINTGALENFLIIDMHHIIADGFSLRKLISDLGVMYDGGEPEAPMVQYRDYAEWISKPLHETLLDPQKRFWQHMFPDTIPRLFLPLDFERPQERDYEGGKVFFGIEGGLFSDLKALAATSNTTLFTVMVTVLNVFLSKICNQQDIVIGTPVNGRNHHQLLHTIGMFVNTLPIRNTVPGDKTFLSFLNDVKGRLEGAFTNDDIPFDHLAQLFDRNHFKGNNPLFDVFLEYDNLDLRGLTLPGLDVTVKGDLIKRAKFDLTLEIIEYASALDCRFEYRTALFQEETIEWLVERFMALVSVLAADGQVRIEDIDLLDEQFSSDEEKVTYVKAK